MKKTTRYILLTFLLGVLFASCEKDNLPGPDARVYGSITDKATGQLVETELVNGSSIEAYELGFATQQLRRWLIKNNGEYRNNLVFSGRYDFKLLNCNFYPVNLTNIEIRPGDNQLDFQVEPYLRIKNQSITYNAAAKKVTATFTVEAGNPAVKLRQVRLYAFSDMYVGENVKFAITGSSLVNYTPSKVVDNGTITLEIDVAANAGLMPSGREYFFRVGALGDVTGVGTVRHNFAPYVKITI